MSRNVRFGARVRYWFDNTMSRGAPSLVGWLALATALLIALVTFALTTVEPPEERNPIRLLWQTFVATFSLAVPEDGSLAVLGLWFILVIAGIFVVSALVGLLTNGLNAALEQLRKGRSVVVEREHTVILGWSDQIFTVITELVAANTSRRRPAITILAEKDKVEMEDLIRQRVGRTGKTRVVCRTGSPLDVSDLEIVNPNESRSVIVLAPPGSSAPDADAYVLKVLLAVNNGPAFKDRPHHVVAAVRDGRNRAVARLAGGDAVVLDADDIGARLVVQTARQPGLSSVYQDLLDFRGNEFYVVDEPRAQGRRFGELLLEYGACCPVGLVEAGGTSVLNPPMDRVIAPGDRLVLLAEDDSTALLMTATPEVDEEAIVPGSDVAAVPERTLILGWNARAARIIEQLDTYVATGSTADIVTDRPDAFATVAQLAAALRQLSTPSVKTGDIRDRATLEQLDIASYDNLIVLSDDLLEPLPADSHVLMTLLHVRDLLRRRGRDTSIVSEMRDERDRTLAQLTRADDFVVSDQLVSLLMTQISESPHLESVFADLFDPAGAEIYIRPADRYIRQTSTLTFATVVEAAARRGELAIGYRLKDPGEAHGVVLNPAKSAPMPPVDRLIVLAQS
ncbi:potassium transporter TrkA [Dactylosporangium vinaceum]|uniref:CASTOR/POLLUX/SYM8 ion channel conserved domain-containing protein n=1 Tax=Dactylosporangium vinaceum TaxID=53362 RepID=A0ABV5MNZ8_9ACTN|nr:hypothetical protein [Dactylosporangium vinaceum]UAB95715.1 potassium transporter TrkA [Dactylosporangium vinaceum]